MLLNSVLHMLLCHCNHPSFCGFSSIPRWGPFLLLCVLGAMVRGLGSKCSLAVVQLPGILCVCSICLTKSKFVQLLLLAEQQVCAGPPSELAAAVEVPAALGSPSDGLNSSRMRTRGVSRLFCFTAVLDCWQFTASRSCGTYNAS